MSATTELPGLFGTDAKTVPPAIGFTAPGLFAWLEAASADALDGLPFGVVAMAADGAVEGYNTAEGKLSGLTPARVIGRNFFTSVAPCTNNFMVAHRFESEPEIDAVIDYVFTFRLAPLKVRLRLLKRPGGQRMYLAVEKARLSMTATLKSGHDASSDPDYEALLEFLYLTPVGIVKFRPDGAHRNGQRHGGAVADAAGGRPGYVGPLSRAFRASAPICAPVSSGSTPHVARSATQLQLPVPGSRNVLTLGINKINPGTLMAVIQDITRAIEQERRIRDDQQRFRAIFENVRDYAIYHRRPRRLRRRMEPLAEPARRLGARRMSPARRSTSCSRRARPGPTCAAGLLDARAAVGTAEFEGWGVRKDGSMFWGNTVATALPDREGRASGYVSGHPRPDRTQADGRPAGRTRDHRPADRRLQPPRRGREARTRRSAAGSATAASSPC